MAADQVTVSDEPKVVGVTAEAAVKAIKAGRNKDVDIAAQIVSDYADQMTGETWSVEEEQKLIRRIDWRLIPTVRNPCHENINIIEY
jgi:ACS family allantoate permease-like MFS transporter